MVHHLKLGLIYLVLLLVMVGCVAPLPVPPAVAPASPATAEATAAPEPETEIGETAVFCPDIMRPAMLLYLPAEEYALFDPVSGERCPLAFVEPVSGRLVAMAQGDIFAAERTTGPEGEATIIRRYRPDGTVEEFPFTMTDNQHGTELVAFAISGDRQLIAWSVLGPTAGSELPSTSLYIHNLETGAGLGGVSPVISEAPRVLEPIRFSADGSVLYYALQPFGAGGDWSSFAGRYDNLYAITTDGAGTPETVFDCADLGLSFCLGDFSVVENTVTGLAYVDAAAGTLIIQNGEGVVLNTLTTEHDYIGYPTWGPGGEFVYYSADLSDDDDPSLMPEMGFLHSVAPHTAPAEILLSDPALLLPVRFLDGSRVVVQWAGENDNSGLALVGMDGTVQVLDVPANAALVDVVPAPAQESVGEAMPEENSYMPTPEEVEQAEQLESYLLDNIPQPIPAPEGWAIKRCEGEAPLLCVETDAGEVGSVMVSAYPLRTYPDLYPTLAAHGIPFGSIDVESEAYQTGAPLALEEMAADFLDSVAEDRRIGRPQWTFVPLEVQPIAFGELPGLQYGFLMTDGEGQVSERVLSHMAFDESHIYFVVATYDPEAVWTLPSDEMLLTVEPHLRQIIAGLPLPKGSDWQQ